MSSSKSVIPESEVVLLWQRQLLQQRLMSDSDGKPVKVIYPGRLNDSRGGDFRDAVVDSGNTPQFGCIEVHTRASGWQAHGHHLDPAYNKVVLHVTLELDRSGKTLLQNGQVIPTVVLDKPAVAVPHGEILERGLPCQGLARRWRLEKLQESLDRAGDTRLANKSRRFALDSGQPEADQSLYQGILEALGYSKNKLPFVQLARNIPLNFLREKFSPIMVEDRLVTLQALLLGTAGLLPSQRHVSYADNGYINQLELSWSTLTHPDTMSCRDWELFKVRPANYPVRRIMALSHLLQRYQKTNWLPALLEIILHSPPERTHTHLELAFMVIDAGYWASHYDFNRSIPAANPVLLGRERASEIVINVVLPFILSWSRIIEKRSLRQKTREIYLHYPRLESNSVERHMLQQLAAGSREVNSARRQQGLIHIYQTLCTQGKCEECDFSR